MRIRSGMAVTPAGGGDYHDGFCPRTEMRMWYLILGRDQPGSLATRLEQRPAHLQRLQDLAGQGRLMLAGPLPAIDAEDPGPAGFSGSAIVAEFESLEQARAWAEADPYRQAGVYASVEVHPFRPVLP